MPARQHAAGAVGNGGELSRGMEHIHAWRVHALTCMAAGR